MEGALSSVPTTQAGTLTRDNTKGYERRAARKRQRTVISQQQLCKLEALYCREQWPKRSTKECLAQELGMSTTFVNIWFQNKRSRIRRAMKLERNQMTKKKSSFPIIRITPIAPKPRPVGKAGFYRNLQNATSPSSERVALGKPNNWKAACEIGLQNRNPLPAIACRFKTKASRVSHYVEKLWTRDQVQRCKAISSQWKSSEPVGRFSSCTRSANRQEIVLGQTSCDPQTSHRGVQEVDKIKNDSRRAEDIPDLLQYFLYMMMITCGHLSGLRHDTRARLTIDACLYGLKLNDGKTVLMDKDYGLVLKENNVNER